MRSPAVTSLHAVRYTAMLALPVVLLACTDGSDTIAPASQSAPMQADVVALPEATSAIMDLVAAATAAWTAKDAAAYAALYATDVQFINPRGGIVVGRDAFRATHVFLFTGPFAGSTQTIEVRDIVFLTGTVALVLQDVALTNYAFLPPGLPAIDGVVRTRVAWIVEKLGGTWEITFQQMTSQLP